MDGYLPDPGPVSPDALHSRAETSLTFERAELEQTVRWIIKMKTSKKGPSVPRTVSVALSAFQHMLHAYPHTQTFSFVAPKEAGQPSGIVGQPREDRDELLREADS